MFNEKKLKKLGYYKPMEITDPAGFRDMLESFVMYNGEPLLGNGLFLYDADFTDSCYFSSEFIICQRRESIEYDFSFLSRYIPNIDQRIDILRKEYPKVKDFLPVLKIMYFPVDGRNDCDKETNLELEFISKGEFEATFIRESEWDYSDEYVMTEEEGIMLTPPPKEIDDFLEYLMNILYFKRNGITCYEAMMEDECDDVEEYDINEVRKLKRLHRQTLDYFRLYNLRKIFSEFM
ncbi:MAG: hypothetical protein K5751_07935 [Treponemataceae bacterium]|nr:hypothetical protein [Treponemataceae bacterium]